MAENDAGVLKILLVIICDSRDEVQSQLELLRENRLIIPDDEDWEFEVIGIIKNARLANALNKLQEINAADFKIYLNAPIVWIDNEILSKVIHAMLSMKDVGMLGTFGSEIPIDGDVANARNAYGLYSFVNEAGKIRTRAGKDALFFQETHTVDNCFFATSVDLHWDEEIGNDFLVAAQCCNMRREGYKVGVAYQEKPWLTFERDECNYSREYDADEYSEQLAEFRRRYGKFFAPLVSVLIPAYNQPGYLKEALDSVLAQTYENIEILIGDDSTNEDVKEMIQPYLEKYPQIRYFYHGGPLGNRGGNNILFLLNHCRGEYVNFLLHDDLFYPKKISRMMECFARDLNGELHLVTSARDLIDEDSEYVKRKNPWQPHRDAVLASEEVGRKALFMLSNFLGELSTVLFRKRDLVFRNPETGDTIFATGCFYGVAGSVYGDLDAWLNILSKGGKCIFLAESLSAFRLHGAQNTYNPYVRTKLPLDMLVFVVIAWLNNVFLKGEDEFRYCLSKWKIMAEMWLQPESSSDSKVIRQLKLKITELIRIDESEDYAKMLDVVISYMLKGLPKGNSIRRLVRKNARTGLWEKADDGILPRFRLE